MQLKYCSENAIIYFIVELQCKIMFPHPVCSISLLNSLSAFAEPLLQYMHNPKVKQKTYFKISGAKKSASQYLSKLPRSIQPSYYKGTKREISCSNLLVWTHSFFDLDYIRNVHANILCELGSVREKNLNAFLPSNDGSNLYWDVIILLSQQK